jgi:ABC-type dipeptide/oligopeptide/nickel transport system permease component
MLRLAFLIVIDIVIVAGISIGVGATAPRWRGKWLTRDFGPLHLAPWETPQFFRAMKTHKSFLIKSMPPTPTIES